MTAANVQTLDLAELDLREVNAAMQSHNDSASDGHYRVVNPRGAHALACGIAAPVNIEIDGHAGYYCAGMNDRASIEIHGNAGVGTAENMMSGRVHVHGDVSQSAAATAHGGLLVVEGNAAARCGISLKGANIVVKGNVGHMSMFMAQSGALVVLGDAGSALGDSLYEARIYIRGKVADLGTDCVEKPMRDEHKAQLRELLEQAGCSPALASEFRRYGSARRLYHFDVDNVDAY